MQVKLGGLQRVVAIYQRQVPLDASPPPVHSSLQSSSIGLFVADFMRLLGYDERTTTAAAITRVRGA